MSFRARTTQCLTITVAILVSSASGCSAQVAPSTALPRTETNSAELFDDVIEASAVGLELDGLASSGRDLRLAERARSGDSVVRVRVETFTARGDDKHAQCELGLRVLQTIAGGNPPPETFTVRIPTEGESAAIAKLMGDRLFKATFIAFVRKSVRADGELEFRFHLSKDDAAVNAAVRRAVGGTDRAEKP